MLRGAGRGSARRVVCRRVEGDYTPDFDDGGGAFGYDAHPGGFFV